MILSIKILEEAIKVRQDEKRRIQEQMLTPINKEQLFFYAADVNNLRSQIAELKRDIQILYDANRLQEIPAKLEK